MTAVSAQLLPPAGGLTQLYVVPSGQSVLGTLVAANRSYIDDQVRVMLVPPGQIPAQQMYIAYDVTVNANYIMQLQEIGIANRSQILVQSQNGTTSFTFTGQALTA
jgi:hypothetical protein